MRYASKTDSKMFHLFQSLMLLLLIGGSLTASSAFAQEAVAQETVLKRVPVENVYAEALMAKQRWQSALEERNLESTKKVYYESSATWRKLVDDTFQVYSLESLAVASEGDDSEVQHYTTLKAVGAIRAQALQQISKSGDYKIFTFNREYVNDLLREMHMVPYRILALLRAKFWEVNGEFNRGWDGILVLIPQAISLSLLGVLLVLFFWGMFRMPVYLDRYRQHLFRLRLRTLIQGKMLFWIPRTSAFVPWVLMLIFLEFSDGLLRSTVVAELQSFSPYVRYYAFYRIFRIILAKVLVHMSIRANLLKEREMRLKVHSTAKYFGIFVFGNLALLHAVETVVSKALVYTIVFDVVRLGAVAFLLWASRKWREEVEQALKSNGDVVSRRLHKYSLGRIGSVIRVAGLLWLIFYYLWTGLLDFLQEFEFVKKISAQVFRKKLEGNQRENYTWKLEDIPEDYLGHFSFAPPEDESTIVNVEKGSIFKVKKAVDAWANEESEESLLALVGEKGAGKSTLASLLCKSYSEKLVVKRAVVPAKLTSKKGVYKFVQEFLELNNPIDHPGTLVNETENMPKTLLVLDGCQNFFLSRLGGFEGYKAFVELLNSQAKNIYWVCMFNREAWNYLNSAFSRHAYFRSVVEMVPWNEDEIRNLIYSRHKKSGYKLSFDQIISAANRSGGEIDYSEIETKFFRLLWEQSAGNPRAAIYYWLSSLRPKSENVLRVGLPQDDEFSLSSLTDEQLFVLASLLRHENLSTMEIVSATHLNESLIRHSLKMALESSLIERDKRGRYRVSPEAQKSVIRSLRVKNYIYG